MSLPPTISLRQIDTHRLIPSKYSDPPVLAVIADDEQHLLEIFDLDNATNDRLRAENNLTPGIGTAELVFGIPNYTIINAAFTHPHPQGGRFNGPDRGAWYAGFEVETAISEVVWHKTLEYAEINWFHDSVTYTDFLADFDAEFHDIRGQSGFSNCLQLGSYIHSQKLADDLLKADALGIIYPSARRCPEPCIACFRPALVGNVRRAERWRFTWSGKTAPDILKEA
ncbi:RES family NAD+ phosphorylase [Acidocella sp.]|uniref:RES family NAD+ phosphorylase n=1 Tax=Acidocella sp. TaxID=50710 RepID=UPI00261FCA36|nr:RES family NAD+ phosphorylase [Acidocella sp.]